MKWCVTQQLCMLQQNLLHQCVYGVMEIIRKIVACQFEQLRDLIFDSLDEQEKFEDEMVRNSTTV